MASTARGSDGGRDHCRSSRAKGKTPVEHKREYNPSKAWLREKLRYLEEINKEYVATEKNPPATGFQLHSCLQLLDNWDQIDDTSLARYCA